MGVVIVNTYQHVIGYRLPVLIRLSSPFAEAESQLVTQTDHEGLFFTSTLCLQLLKGT